MRAHCIIRICIVITLFLSNFLYVSSAANNDTNTTAASIPSETTATTLKQSTADTTTAATTTAAATATITTTTGTTTTTTVKPTTTSTTEKATTADVTTSEGSTSSTTLTTATTSVNASDGSNNTETTSSPSATTTVAETTKVVSSTTEGNVTTINSSPTLPTSEQTPSPSVSTGSTAINSNSTPVSNTTLTSTPPATTPASPTPVSTDSIATASTSPKTTANSVSTSSQSSSTENSTKAPTQSSTDPSSNGTSTAATSHVNSSSIPLSSSTPTGITTAAPGTNTSTTLLTSAPGTNTTTTLPTSAPGTNTTTTLLTSAPGTNTSTTLPTSSPGTNTTTTLPTSSPGTNTSTTLPTSSPGTNTSTTLPTSSPGTNTSTTLPTSAPGTNTTTTLPTSSPGTNTTTTLPTSSPGTNTTTTLPPSITTNPGINETSTQPGSTANASISSPTQTMSVTSSVTTASGDGGTTQQTTPADPCNAVACVNGTCQVMNGTATCICTAGFTGDNCSIDIDECNSNPCKNNGTCKDDVNKYTCSCISGFNGTNCENNIDDCKPNPCVNGTCTDGINDYTCKCDLGYDGKNCSINIDDCTPDPCVNGNCTDGINDYSCKCDPGYNGENCSINIDECLSTPCKNGGSCQDDVNKYTCDCTPGYNGTHCQENINECTQKNVTCENGGTCRDLVNNYTCDCTKGWEGSYCEQDVDECDTDKPTHDCHRNAQCNNTDGSYSCKCKDGYEGDGKTCSDINECEKDVNNTLCKNGGICFNIPGNYSCYCTPYWNGTRCDEDIDECNIESSPCADNATCNNSQGNFSCSCDEGFKGIGTDECFLITVIETEGDLQSGDDNITGSISISEVIYYYGKPYNSFYVSMDGYITLGSQLKRRYPPSGSSNWESFPVIAPLWADIETSGSDSGVQYAVVNDTKTLGLVATALNTSNVSLSIIVTWKKAAPYPFKDNHQHESADFQAIISKVGLQTIVMFNYDLEFFTWKTGVNRPVAVGYSNDDTTGSIKFENCNITEVIGNRSEGIRGRWIFNVTSTEKSWIEESECLSASSIRSNIDSARNDLGHCPCSRQQVQRDMRFKKHNNRNQFISRFRRGAHNARLRCHYSDKGSLLQGYPDGGYIDIDGVEAKYNTCCANSNSKTCALFYNMNPSDTCNGYRAPSWAPSWGDPHITTLDGANYTFNARGEFILLKHHDMTVQVRTDLANENNTDATVFVGLAVQVRKATKLELVLDRVSQTAKIYINGSLNGTIGNGVSSLSIQLRDMELHYENNIANITSTIGISIKVTISDILDIVVLAPTGDDFNTTGLVGNNNGNANDDFRPRNDTDNPIKADSSERDIYEKFGMTWRINENETLFSYTSGRNFTYFNDDNIKPYTFISDLKNMSAYLNKMCGINVPDITSCGRNRACLVDTAATCNNTFGARSKATEKVAIEEKRILDHMPPKFDLPNPLYVGLGENSTVEARFNFNINVNTSIQKEFFQENNSYFFWNITNELRNLPVYLQITGTDDENATSVYSPDIYYCGCSAEAECDYSLIVKDGPVNGTDGKFFQARCKCSGNMSGQFCEIKVDVCKNCFNESACNASAPSNQCGPCPEGMSAGMSSDGERCYDINECTNKTLNNCDQTCINTNGSFTCGCDDGYELDIDKATCKDINECEKNPDVCAKPNEYCYNTNGGNECLCRPGFSRDVNDDKCKKGEAVYAGIIVLRTWIDKTQIEEKIRTFLNNTFSKAISLTLIEVTVIRTETRRRKRSSNEETNKNGVEWKANFVIHTNESVPTSNVSTILHNALDKDSDGHGVSIGEKKLVTVDIKRSKVYTDEEGGICTIPGKTDCDSVSTDCKSSNGGYTCQCKAGFHGWENPDISCKDINECEVGEVCKKEEGGNCTNTPGSYICTCPPGLVYNKPACEDVCDPNPCKNGGQCVHGALEAQYLCKCDDKWTGGHCEDKNEEAAQLKIIAIAVGSSVGAVCLLLLCAMFGMYRRHRFLYGGYRKSLSSDFDTTFRMAGTRSNIQTKDFHIDDDADTNFSIPRPKLARTPYDSFGDRDSATYNALEEHGESGMMEEIESPLTRTSKEVVSNGEDNPSFLHSRSMEKARLSSKRTSRNPYEYF